MASLSEAAAVPEPYPVVKNCCSPENEPILEPEADHTDSVAQKKKKKKKPKKSAAAKAKDTAAKKAAESGEAEGRPSVLCISRNKHWKYISSYHGPWLQLPVELLESLFALNLDPATLTVPEPIPQPFSSSRIPITGPTNLKLRDRGFESLRSELDSPGGGRFTDHEHYMLTAATQLPPPSLPLLKPGTAPPPPIDPGVLKNVTSIRRLIDEAAELSVRASSGLSAAELSSPSVFGGMSGYALNGSTWAAAQTLGINPLGGNGGRNVAMSAMRIHRLRALAVQKLAQAYKADEIASSVMVMQGGSVFDDVAEKVLKVDPNDADAKYVHFFHEKIPSRQLAESTTTQILDELIAANPQRLEFFRTRGVVHCFRDEYTQAIKDFTHALKEARAVRRAKMLSHDHKDFDNSGGKGSMREKGSRGAGASGKKKKGRNTGGVRRRTNGQAPPNGTSAAAEDGDEEASGEGDSALGDVGDLPPPLHPSALPDAPDPIEPQLLFLRGSAYLQKAVHLIELTVLDVEGLDENARPKEETFKSKHYFKNNPPNHYAFDTSEFRLCYLQDSLYGGVEIGNPGGPLGSSDGPKLKAYRKALAADGFREQITSYIKKGIRDHERFLSHFDTLEADPSHEKGKGGTGREDLKEQTQYAFTLSESTRPGNYSTSSGSSPYTGYSTHIPPPVTMFTTYHPLVVESHYTILLALLMLGDFSRILPTFIRTASLVEGLEGYPVFLPPRSMAQAEFVEVLERLAGGWKKGHFEDEYALVLRGRNATTSPSSLPASRAASIYSPASTSGSSSPTTTTTDLYDDVLGTESSATDVGEGGSSTSEPSCSASALTATATSASVDTFASSTISSNVSPRPDAADALDSLRILLAPVIARQRERAEAAAAEKKKEKTKGKRKGGQDSPMPLNIPLHGPRVEIVLAWLAAVHLPELDV
ncbi:hypothetical protein C8J55DRAFT_152706 [Lentinula edodes]|uniref:Uncharacterized protein n=1 Tax=Lentinula lateritia TaxID=40482 RepID=A0A9W9A0V1_9AGAR|nr:hypothetical protein C8J55DRAFT_152706 [Lentinula edodes]